MVKTTKVNLLATMTRRVDKTVGEYDGGSVGDADVGTNVVCAALGYIDGNNVGNEADGENDEGESVGNDEGR